MGIGVTPGGSVSRLFPLILRRAAMKLLFRVKARVCSGEPNGQIIQQPTREIAMYDFVKTATGWRVFWGVSPLADEEPVRQDTSDNAPVEPAVLPFQKPDADNDKRPAA